MLKTIKKWLLTSSLSIIPCDVLHDTDSGKDIIYYDPDNEVFNIDDSVQEQLYATEEEVLQKQSERLSYLKDMAEQIPNLIDDIYFIDDGVCNFDREPIRKIRDETYYRKQYIDVYNKYKLLSIYVKTGMINVNAVSLRKDDVAYIKWLDQSQALITTKGGMTVMTCNEAEYEVIELLFGYNESSRVFKLQGQA